MKKNALVALVAITGATSACCDKTAIQASANDILLKIDPIKAAATRCKTGDQAQCDNVVQAIDDVKTDASDILKKTQ